MLEKLFAFAIVAGARVVTGLRSFWVDTSPSSRQRIYFANHSSHADFVLLWAALPTELRSCTRPIAGADYWGKGRLRRFIISRVFRGVLINRGGNADGTDPLAPIHEALSLGDSLILFPEGTRNLDDEERLQPLKSGIYRLANAHPEVELIPVWLNNLNRVMPKGRTLPLPLLCTLTFGSPLPFRADESKEAFLERARSALLMLSEGC